MNFLESLQTKDVFTENGMLTNSTTMNECVNLFFTIGAMRGQDKSRLLSMFSKSFNESPITAMKILFWSRDVREGAGERQIFKDIIEFLAQTHPNELRKNIHLISEYGRWDDIFSLFGTELEKDVLDLIVVGLEKGDGLCSKWIPRKGVVFNKIRKRMKTTPKELRQLLVRLSNTVEQKMCAKEWQNIEYSKVPSLAMSRYTKVFTNRDQVGFSSYLQSLKEGTTKVNASTLYPYDVIKNLQYGNQGLANEQWKALPNYMGGSSEKILPVVDVSGSMQSLIGGKGSVSCMDVSISLGMYISERNEGMFKDHFITFSSKPELQKLVGNLKERLLQLQNASWGMNTNLEAVFTLILNKALESKVSESEMPTKILIMSDMEFDEAQGGSFTAQEMIREKYNESGYKMPDIIYWNIQSRNSNFPVKFDEKGTALISGLSPSILKSILSGENMSPVKIMEETLNKVRYKDIKV
jgi:hypothetical protein